MRQITQRALRRIAGLLSPGVHGGNHEVEIRTEIDWKNPHRSVVSAPAGTIALVKEIDESLTVVDIFLEPIVAFAVVQYPQRTIRIRNAVDRDVTPGWYVASTEPITATETSAEDIVAISHALPDGSTICNGVRYASIDEMFDTRRARILTAQ